MTALIVVACILVFLAVLMLAPVVVSAGFDEELSLRVRYLFLSFRLLPQQEEEDTEEKEEKEEQKKKDKLKKEKTKAKLADKTGSIKDIIKQKGTRGFLELLKSLSNAVAGPLKKLFSHVVFRRFFLDLAVGGDDAAEIAVDYGRVCAVVYPAVGALISVGKCKRYHVCVLPDFNGGKTRMRFSAKASIRPCFLLSAAASAFFRWLRAAKGLAATKAK